MSKYYIGASYVTIRDALLDEGRLRFHVENDDYFGMLATALGFIEEHLERLEEVVAHPNTTCSSSELALLKKLRAEAQHLHNHYIIGKRQSL